MPRVVIIAWHLGGAKSLKVEVSESKHPMIEYNGYFKHDISIVENPIHAAGVVELPGVII